MGESGVRAKAGKSLLIHKYCRRHTSTFLHLFVFQQNQIQNLTTINIKKMKKCILMTISNNHNWFIYCFHVHVAFSTKHFPLQSCLKKNAWFFISYLDIIDFCFTASNSGDMGIFYNVTWQPDIAYQRDPNTCVFCVCVKSRVFSNSIMCSDMVF